MVHGWHGAATIKVTNPVDESGDLHRAEAWPPRKPATLSRVRKKHRNFGARKPPRSVLAILRKWFNLMMEHQEDLAQILTAEQGKPLAESRGEIAYGASFHRMVRRRGAPRLWRNRSGAIPQWPRRRDQAARWRHCLHHAVELPQRHDHPESRCGSRRRLHHGGEACR